MKITVFGASGRIGQIVVRKLLADGHKVRAFVHSKDPFNQHHRLEVIHGDIQNHDDVRYALEKTDGVISTLGSWHTKDKNILSSGMKTIIPGMETSGINRIVTLTGSDARDKSDTLGFIHKISHPLLKVVGRKVLHDAEEHLRLLHASKLDWYSLRSPVITKSGSTDFTLTMRRPKPWSTIHEEAVAEALILQLLKPANEGRIPFIVRL
jgi:uncharacterized protein